MDVLYGRQNHLNFIENISVKKEYTNYALYQIAIGVMIVLASIIIIYLTN